MAVSAAFLDENATSPTLFMDPEPQGSPVSASHLLLRRRSSKKLLENPLNPSQAPSQAQSEELVPPTLSMAVCAAQLDETGASLTVTLDSTSQPAGGKGPSLLLRRQSSRKLVADKQQLSPGNGSHATIAAAGSDGAAGMELPMLSMAVCAAQLDENEISPTLTLGARSSAGGNSPSLLLRRQSSKQLVGNSSPSPSTASLQDASDTTALTAPVLSMAVCAAQLEETGSSLAVSLDADAGSGKGPSLLLRRQSSKRLVGSTLASPSTEPSPDANDTTALSSPMLSMAVCAAQLEETGASFTVTLDAASHAGSGKGPSLLLRRQSSKKLVADKQLSSPKQAGSV
jgi:hypothetical protein